MSVRCDHLGVVYNGDECYSSAMENSRKVLRTFTGKLLQCVENLLTQESGNSRTICIAEFGAADGGVSLELMDTVIGGAHFNNKPMLEDSSKWTCVYKYRVSTAALSVTAIDFYLDVTKIYMAGAVDEAEDAYSSGTPDKMNQTSSDKREIILVYEDQLLNDYNVLFKTVHAENLNGSTKLTAMDNVHVLASATSMYRKCLPTGFVDLAISSMSNHWLSQRPCHIRGGIYQSDSDTEELAAFRQQWQTDWKQFLCCRAKEIRPGGYMIVISFIIGDNGRYATVGEDLHDVYTHIWKDFWQNGKITEEEFVNSTQISYVPSKAELVQPFHTDMDNSLLLVDCTQKAVEIIPGVAASAGVEDIKLFVERSLRCTKACLYNILRSGLSLGRTEAEKSKILDEYFQTLHNNLMQKTSFSPLFYNTACVIAKRIES